MHDQDVNLTASQDEMSHHFMRQNLIIEIFINT